MGSVDVGGRRICYDDTCGDLPALVLLQGFMASRGVWTWQVEAFSPHFRVITMDNRDAGESDPESSTYAMADLAADVLALLDALGIERVSVIGHSMGGYVALHFADLYPERLDKLVLVGTSALAGGALGRPAPSYDRSRFIEDPAERTRSRYGRLTAPGYFDSHPEQLEALAESARGNRLTFEGMARQSDAAFMTHDTREALPKIAAPVLVVHGDLDQTIPISAGRKIAQAISGARIIEFEGVGHLPHIERVEEFNRLVLEFLTGNQSA